MTAAPIRTVAVVGDGIAGWSAAIAFAARLPGVQVAVVPAAGRPAVIDGHAVGTPASVEFHRDMGIDLRDLRSVRRRGTCYVGWATAPFVHAYGPVGVPVDSVPFAALWPWYGTAPFDHHAPAARLALAGVGAVGGHPLFDEVAHGVALAPADLRDRLAATARARGVRRTAAPFAGADWSGDRVDEVALADGGRLRADLFVDASGPDGQLIGSAPGSEWQSWSDVLPCDRVRINPAAAPAVLDRVETTENGYRMDDAVAAWSSRFAGDADGGTAIAPGRRTRAWIGNVVAVGEAAAVLLPLEGLPLHLLHTQLDRLTATLCDTAFDPVELDHHNAEAAEEADRLRDLQALLFLRCMRAEPFWDACRATVPSAELAETIALFAARGRLRVRDGEGFSADSWRMLLFGLGLRPTRPDILVARADPARVRAAFAADLRAIDDAVARAAA